MDSVAVLGETRLVSTGPLRKLGGRHTSVKAMRPASIFLPPGENLTFLAAPAGPLCDVLSSATFLGLDDAARSVGEAGLELEGNERISNTCTNPSWDATAKVRLSSFQSVEKLASRLAVNVCASSYWSESERGLEYRKTSFVSPTARSHFPSGETEQWFTAVLRRMS